MGDRSWHVVWVAPQHVNMARELLDLDYEFEGAPDVDEATGAHRLFDGDTQIASDDFQKLADSGVDFWGAHGACGGVYEPGVFAFADGEGA